jgi:hypothetical protein
MLISSGSAALFLSAIKAPPATKMTAAILSSPTRSAKAATAMSSKSPTRNNNSNKLSAAADLIRNLDAALLEMTNSAAKSADDAARARRNARTAAEVS